MLPTQQHLQPVHRPHLREPSHLITGRTRGPVRGTERRPSTRAPFSEAGARQCEARGMQHPPEFTAPATDLWEKWNRSPATGREQGAAVTSGLSRASQLPPCGGGDTSPRAFPLPYLDARETLLRRWTDDQPWSDQNNNYKGRRQSHPHHARALVQSPPTLPPAP